MADDPIKHIVVLMFENRSFDHILGGTQKMRAPYDLSGTNKYGRKSYSAAAGRRTASARRSRARDQGRADATRRELAAFHQSAASS